MKNILVVFYVLVILTLCIPTVSGSIDLQVSSSADDAHEYADGYFSYTDSNLFMRSYAAIPDRHRMVGVRFNNVQIPHNSTINNAYVQLYCNDAGYDDADCYIYAHDIGNADNFANNPNIFNITERPRTTANIFWGTDSLGAGWTNSPEIKTVIQEIVNRGDWNSNNNISILFITDTTGDEKFYVRSWDGNNSRAPKIHIDYTSPNPASNITSWQNNKTLNNTLDIIINTSEEVNFNATSNQTITTWNWYKDDVDQSHNYNNITLNWSSTGLKYIVVNATNPNGTSNSITWNVTVESVSAPSITSYAPTTSTSSYENVDKSFNVTVDQIVNITWYLNGDIIQTNTSVFTALYTNTTSANGTWNVTSITTNINGSDSQIWNWTVLSNSVDIVYRNVDYSNLTANVLIDISNKTAGLQTINIPWIGNLSSEYCLNYPNGTAVQSCVACTSESDTVWFNGSANRLPELNGYYINESLGQSTMTIPANSWGMFNNWTSSMTFAGIAANESNDICYTYYNVTSGLWESYYVGYSWNGDYQLSKDTSVIGYFNAQTDITSSIITPSSTELYTGWNMVGVQSSSNQTISGIIADIGANCSDSWYFNSSTGSYSNTITHSIQPNQGFLAYITQNMTWTRSAM